ncbi:MULTISPECIES: radical SAM family heme chaperone HemW [unclassified Apibacter]|uniref:radical SAM family heme chaperone HemW n=1 Tax=unclassified Apibacter TaxID=2630820 RepID=UPI0013237BEF|nr:MULTISPECIES: radical SAM family heme chaperone HemW [unclassified Apibacter]MCX8676570.1 radical SAM family heme chaperone HemW [Apibacter sp. B3919]MXO24031.1 radical SAM family heme chaperone HemW [Apibacter sp. B3924]MXO26291.1 radical SAM family heme chaperone HemW [Apibacter sp. B3813]MXO28242.1 radical SAM family heme chaperone HemW [Apibacter sp. B3913]MXO30196.1 radical SAM family heme chaperone HemW [Apibacter sp. B3912]
MSGLYIHIPFCVKKCNYCNFHFSTQFNYKSQLIQAIGKELIIRKNELISPIETIYFGGGTPSILNYKELEYLFTIIKEHYDMSETKEITFEANPDDLSVEYLHFLKNQTPVNRLSIGIQSFIDEDIKFMNRNHNADEAIQSIRSAQDIGFNNITIDLIYGAQTTTHERWMYTLEKAISLGIPHISSYALTVEPKTAFEAQIRKNKLPPIDEEKQAIQFETLRNKLIEHKYIQYEFSNFGKETFFSQHNTSYWKNKPYLGIGPSAHSYNGIDKRCWNVSHNIKYLKAIENNILNYEEEVISEKDRFNEKIMLGLRTLWGINIDELEKEFSSSLMKHFYKELKKLEATKKVRISNQIVTIHPESLFFTDGIIAQFFFID